jgi:hypothetical protein
LKVKAYYGSTVKFDDWDITRTREFGYHFGIDDKEQSLHRIASTGGYLYEVSLTFSNPLTMRDALRWDVRAIAEELGVDPEPLEVEARQRAKKNFGSPRVEQNLIAARLLDKHGFDAIVYDNLGETGGKAIIVWHPGQIRVESVTSITHIHRQLESSLRALVRSMLSEVDIGEVEGICMAEGSTHIMNTCFIGGDKFHLKFSDEAAEFAPSTDPSLQILVEWLAYKIYSLYPGVDLPEKIDLVYDKARSRVGLATSSVPGRHGRSLGRDVLAQGLSAGVYVDVFLANWDIGNTANIIARSSDSKPVRIDPGGALTFRARGSRKGRAFGDYPGELETMISGNTAAADIFKYSDLRVAARTFSSVPWARIESQLVSCDDEINEKLTSYDLTDLLEQWNSDFNHIMRTLRNRHREILENVEFMKHIRNSG